MIVVHRLNALLAVCVGVSSALVFVGGHEAGELDVFTGLAFGGFSLWGGFMAGTRWVRLGEETVVAPLHGRIRWVDVEAVNVDEVTGTAFFPRTAVILSVAGSKGMRRVALTEVSRKIGNPATDALAIECERRVASAHAGQ